MPMTSATIPNAIRTPAATTPPISNSLRISTPSVAAEPSLSLGPYERKVSTPRARPPSGRPLNLAADNPPSALRGIPDESRGAMAGCQAPGHGSRRRVLRRRDSDEEPRRVAAARARVIRAHEAGADAPPPHRRRRPPGGGDAVPAHVGEDEARELPAAERVEALELEPDLSAEAGGLDDRDELLPHVRRRLDVLLPADRHLG